MAKMTLLEMVQDILSSLGGDEVNDISDTNESVMITAMIKDSYNYLISSIDFPENETLFELEASGDITQPNIMTLPANCDNVQWVRYNNTQADTDDYSVYNLLEFKEMNEFFELLYGMTADATQYIENVVNFGSGEEFETRYYNDRGPSYYTVLGDRTLLFDAVNLVEDDTLQKSKSMAFGKLSPAFIQSNTFIPALNSKQFTLLYNEAKSQAFYELKQTANPVSERRARKGWIRSQKQSDSVVDPYANYRSLLGYGRRR